MKKGQLSIDLLLTLLVAILVIGGLGALILSYSEAGERATIQQELQYTADKTASLITTAGTLNDTNFTIKTQIRKIFYTDENNNYRNAYPDIALLSDGAGEKINASITVKGQRQDANAYFYRADAKTQLVLTSLKTDGNVVITHAP